MVWCLRFEQEHRPPSKWLACEIGFLRRESGKLPLWWPYSQEIPGESYYTLERMLCYKFVTPSVDEGGVFALSIGALSSFRPLPLPVFLICPTYPGTWLPFGLDLQVWISLFCSLPSVILGGISLLFLLLFLFLWSSFPVPHSLYVHYFLTTHCRVSPLWSEVAQSCPTLCDAMDTRLLRPWDFLGKSTGVGCHFLFQETSRLRNWTQVPHIVDGCFTIWATREVLFIWT